MENKISPSIDTNPSWDPVGYATHAGFVATLGVPVLALLAPQPGERVLDLGCGDGALTTELVAAGCEVVAVDQSPAQVGAARARGLDARVADGQALAFSGEFDAVFSNAALHWMRDADAVLSGVARALRPGGRFVAELGGHGCVAAIRVALYAVLARRGLDGPSLDPWYFPTIAEYGARLTAAGFQIDEIALLSRPTPLPTGLAGWLETFASPFLGALPPSDRLPARDEAIALATPALRDQTGTFIADYTRLRFAAHRERS